MGYERFSMSVLVFFGAAAETMSILLANSGKSGEIWIMVGRANYVNCDNPLREV